MNRNCIFLVSMICVSTLLVLLRLTGMTAHIIVSVVGLAIMIPMTVLTRREWKMPALEIIMRALYLAAIVTGGVIMSVGGPAALGTVHVVCAVLFIALLFALYIPKCVKK